MIHRNNVPRKNKQKRRQRTQFVDSHPLLHLHPLFDLPRVLPHAPPLQINHHHPRVEVTRSPVRERQRERRVRPKGGREVGGEVRVAVLRRRQNSVGFQRRGGEFRDVVDEYEVGVEVDHALDAAWD